MSSNTLRGVGQEGDGDNATTPPAGRAEPGSPPAGAGQGADLAPPLADIQKIRSLDSTVPGTRSLDSSVPDASPPLDGKVPSLAATMMGMTAPNIPGRNAAENGRDKGTVQGRDVHLPVEMQRRAGVIPVPGAGAPPRHDPAPLESGPSEPAVAEGVRAPHGAPELNSHGPWYEQEPSDADAYDDPRPNLIGRVAIGAAIAASLSVVLFAIVRVRAQSQAQEAEAAAQMAAPAPATAAASPSTVTPATTAPAPTEPRPADPPPPVIDWDGTGVEVPPPAAAAAPEPRRPPPRTPAVLNRPEPASGSSRPRPSAAAARPAPVAPLPNNLFRPKALDDVPTAGASTEPPPAGVAPPPVGAGPPAAPLGAATQPPPSGATPSQPSAPTPADAPNPARPKGKAYDPDSTLPLNAE
jgi:hypothetical protein